MWAVVVFGAVHGLLMVYGLAHPSAQMGLELFISFTLNVAVLGWCYVDAEEKLFAISGLQGFLLLFIAWIGVPFYFLRSRGLLGALKGAFGLWLFGLWFCALLLAGVIAETIRVILAR